MLFLLKKIKKFYIIKVGDNMKKIFGMLLILVLLYLVIQVTFRFFGNGHEYKYQITTNDINFNIKEKFINNTKNELDSYYFEINNSGTQIIFFIVENDKMSDGIVFKK